MRISLLAVLVALFGLLGDADQALAWGPATHMGLASCLLERLCLLPAAVGMVLGRHRLAYLYGNIAADIVFVKRWSRIKRFCHHWSTAFDLLEAAEDDRAKAFAYGYLAHLAADTVAHGKYVPRQIGLSECSVGFGHIYWELRADATETDENWELLEDVLNGDHDDHHRTLESHMSGTFLPYELNRLVFGRMNALTVRREFRRTVELWNRCSRWYLSPELVDSYRAESLDRIYSILSEGHRSPLLTEDPNGMSALMCLRVRRREVRRLRRRGLPVKHRLLEASRSLAPTGTNVEMSNVDCPLSIERPPFIIRHSTFDTLM